MENFKLGLDIGGTNIKSVLLDNNNRIFFRTESPSHAREGAPSVRRAVHAAVKAAQVSAKSRLLGIGIGCAGSVDTSSGIVVNSPNFTNWSNVPLADWVSEDTALPTKIFNDAKCATVAEWSIGAARGYKNVILLTFGTGIGGGIILNNSLYTGATGTAGELGHLTIRFDGIPCPCGNRGCFERYCSASSLSLLFPNISAETLFSEVNQNPQFRIAVDDFMTALKTGLVGIANTFDPDCILLGGGLANGFSPYMPILSDWVRCHSFPTVGRHVHLKLCELGTWAGATGAALQSFS